ncbi:MAG: hypothetical protein EBY37_10255 [Flavobacteriia bacterium]|nr:hypothetical protein [Flavobacteriia bacterium]
MKKRITNEDIEQTMGPMNSVAKEDAMAYAGAPEVKHLSQLEPHKEREVRAKKKKIKRSTTKHDRAIGKAVNKLY